MEPARRTVPLTVLGQGRVDGRILRRRPLDWHGIPGLAWRLDVGLPDGTVLQATQLGHGRPAFADPRVACA